MMIKGHYIYLCKYYIRKSFQLYYRDRKVFKRGKALVIYTAADLLIVPLQYFVIRTNPVLIRIIDKYNTIIN